jgi:methyltransferase (TIGR00027 family)
MKRAEASATAAWVATARGVGPLLPDHLQLVTDPYGVHFATGVSGRLARLALRRPRLGRALLAYPGPLQSFLLWMQLRTRTLDDIVRSFAQRGGRQLVLLGAGYDCRALRLSDALQGGRVFEVDHPATQARKRARVPTCTDPQVSYVAWDFERDPLEALPERLAQQGLDPRRPTLTLWEGVTMYLSEAGVERTVRAVQRWGARDSWLAFTYLDVRAVHRPRGDAKLTARLVAHVGEPYRFGWDPPELPRWLEQRGFALREDHSDAELALRHFPASVARRFARGERHIALASTR